MLLRDKILTEPRQNEKKGQCSKFLNEPCFRSLKDRPLFEIKSFLFGMYVKIPYLEIDDGSHLIKWQNKKLAIIYLLTFLVFLIHEIQMSENKASTVAHACNPSTLGGRGRRITQGWEFETSLANMVNPVSTKNTKISWVWWWAPVVPATWEAEVGRSPQVRSLRLAWWPTW